MPKHSTYIDKIRIFAAFSVVCAHAAPVNEGTNFANSIAGAVLNIFGAMGVPVFFIISGYLFFFTKKSFVEFWINKLKTVVIPWFFCFSGLWLYVVIRKGGISLRGWINFVIGNGSSAYYLTLLIVFYLLFWKLRTCRIAVSVICLLSVLQIIATGWGIFPLSSFGTVMGSLYLNPLHFAVYFGLGMLCAGYDAWDETGKVCGKFLWISLPVMSVLVAAHLYYGIDYSYFSKFALLNTIVSTAVFFGISYKMEFHKFDIFDSVGRLSFSIYLLHQFLVGAVVKVTNYGEFFVLTLLRPFVVIASVMFALSALEFIANKVGDKSGWVLMAVGVRKGTNNIETSK